MEEPAITRRRLIGATAAGAVAAAAAARPEAEANGVRPRPRPRTRRADVAVVGAGLAGLVAARALRRAGRSVVVLEARDRVGGRVLAEPVGGGAVAQLGAEFVGPTQDRILALARALRVGTFPTYNEGRNVQLFGGRRGLYPASGLPTDPGVAGDLPAALAALDAMARRVPVGAPWRAARAAAWDSQTLESWKLGAFRTAAGRAAFDTAIKSILGAEPRDVSLLFLLSFVAAAGNERNPGSVMRLISTAGGAQELRLAGGSQLIARRLARALAGRVELGAAARRITEAAGRVRIDCDGLVVHARRVVVAMPPALTAELEYRPALPAGRAQLVQRLPQGSLIKCQAVYARPFWRRRGLTGQAVSDAGLARTTFDTSARDGRPGVLLGFVGGREARRWGGRSRAARRSAVLRDLADLFGAEALRPRRYLERDWSREAWTRGCPTAFAAPGVLLDYGSWIRRPIGRIHWAGSETSTFWAGYMDGAVRSGERAAREVLGAERAWRRRSG